ncbi:hypothetical protein DFH06DRAFT_192211 [Mycena polygramma]|nr:hypothetical protein DFH06DRAFT_192211 [Mycena polygramma]
MYYARPRTGSSGSCEISGENWTGQCRRSQISVKYWRVCLSYSIYRPWCAGDDFPFQGPARCKNIERESPKPAPESVDAMVRTKTNVRFPFIFGTMKYARNPLADPQACVTKLHACAASVWHMMRCAQCARVGWDARGSASPSMASPSTTRL